MLSADAIARVVGDVLALAGHSPLECAHLLIRCEDEIAAAATAAWERALRAATAPDVDRDYVAPGLARTYLRQWAESRFET